MAEGVVLTVNGVDVVIRQFRGIEHAATDARPLWDKLADRFERAEARTFDNRGGGSGKWAALSPNYAAWKAKRYPGQPLMEREGYLRRSLAGQGGGRIDVRTDRQMVQGTDVEYARYHQDGTKKMPARPLIDFTNYEIEAWVKAMRDHLLNQIGGIE